MASKILAIRCFMCGHEFRENERTFTLVTTSIDPQAMTSVGRGKDVKVCRDCFLDVAAEEEGDDGV